MRRIERTKAFKRDYQRVIATVRATADSLSTYLEEIW